MLRRLKFDVYLTDPEAPEGYAEHVVEVIAADRLKAELEAGKQKLPDVKTAPQNHTALWLWCSMVRTGDCTVAYQEFKRTLLDLQAVEEEQPDPTTADPSASPSSSPPTSEADPTTGSTSPTTDS